jgi:putative FmdB family regulatory protein
VPTYEYECTNCHRRYEFVQKFTDPPMETCEACGGKLKRVWTSVGVVLKGSGFYSTDNRARRTLTPAQKEGGSDGASGSEKSGSEKSGSEKSGSEKSGFEKKPAEKKEAKPAAKKDSGSGSGSGSSGSGSQAS